MEPDYLITTLSPDQDRKGFDCGVPELNRYLKERATQDIRRRAAGCWVLVDAQNPKTILGFYALSPEGVATAELPDLEAALRKKLPAYKRVGAVLLGRLAIALSHQGKRLGERLLMDAFHRALEAEIPYVLMLTDPKNKKAESFYEKYGFQPLTPGRMFIPMVTAAELLAGED